MNFSTPTDTAEDRVHTRGTAGGGIGTADKGALESVHGIGGRMTQASLAMNLAQSQQRGGI